MILCAAVDDNMGMTFNKRRQSQDRVLRERLLELIHGEKLWMNNYTAKQFEVPLAGNIIVDDDFLDKAGDDDFCFAENTSVAKYRDKIKKIILFKWNRVYPADTYFDISFRKNEWRLVSTTEFEGSSHKKITIEEWENVKNS